MKPSLQPVAMTTNETARPPLDTFILGTWFLLSSLGSLGRKRRTWNPYTEKRVHRKHAKKGRGSQWDRKRAGERENNEEPNYCLLCNRNLLACSSWNNGLLHIDYATQSSSAKRSPRLFFQLSSCAKQCAVYLSTVFIYSNYASKASACLQLSAPLPSPTSSASRIPYVILKLFLSLISPPDSQLPPPSRLALPSLALLGSLTFSSCSLPRNLFSLNHSPNQPRFFKEPRV